MLQLVQLELTIHTSKKWNAVYVHLEQKGENNCMYVESRNQMCLHLLGKEVAAV